MRTASVARKTNETDIRLSLNLDGTGKSTVESGVGFLDHMLTLLARHGGLDLDVTCHGDTQVDDHHSVEDIGIALGDAFAQALGDKRGINRYASLHLRQVCGRNSHHIVEGAFKALGRALRQAVAIDPRFETEIPSTKGML